MPAQLLCERPSPFLYVTQSNFRHTLHASQSRHLFLSIEIPHLPRHCLHRVLTINIGSWPSLLSPPQTVLPIRRDLAFLKLERLKITSWHLRRIPLARVIRRLSGILTSDLHQILRDRGTSKYTLADKFSDLRMRRECVLPPAFSGQQ